MPSNRCRIFSITYINLPLKKLELAFGSFDAFRDQFTAAANAVQGSGWGILVWNPAWGRLEVLQAEKHENLTQWGIDPDPGCGRMGTCLLCRLPERTKPVSESLVEPGKLARCREKAPLVSVSPYSLNVIVARQTYFAVFPSRCLCRL